MESLERTPTPREELFALGRQLLQLVSSREEFYAELVTLSGEGEIDVSDEAVVAQYEKFFNEQYTITPSEDEENNETKKVNVLEIIRSKFSELSLKIESALQEEKFGELIDFLESEQHHIHDDELFTVVNVEDDFDLQQALDVLIDWYNKILSNTISLVDKLYSDPEFVLK